MMGTVKKVMRESPTLKLIHLFEERGAEVDYNDPHIPHARSGRHEFAMDSVPLDDGIADLVFMINLHHELENPSRMIEESRRLLKTDGKILIVDWKKKDMPEGPPTEIRFAPEQVQAQLSDAGFKQVAVYNELLKHFLVVGTKTEDG